ncbi:hypothetical protein NTE_01176 [Candidatus Nitrososphaera evergladensis SR1]|uniref:Uncharacterized protein n=1 Tax=Candidatus Nitrososphaera evergladensis SR1 TaxID=1459636 RepID=A0A075MVG3_9ARCH|nr:hypothetical protein [Candidatus Nitrososphaera evergladensis]AIF83249.1 hypothetical protein NTE_01176 [Candidatus Nitrososphaera evergladensis SR1]
MQKKTTTIVMAALIACVVAIGAIYASNNLALQPNGTGSKAVGSDFQTVSAEQFCQTREEALAKTEGKIQVKEPTYLPAEYKFVCGDGSPDVVLMFYGGGRPLEKSQLNRNGLIESGAVLVATKHAEPDIPDRKAEIEASFQGVNPDLKTRITEINGNVAAVREQCQDCGKGFLTYENGTTVQTGSFGLTSIIVFYDGNQKYLLEAYMPSDELEKIAKSLV